MKRYETLEIPFGKVDSSFAEKVLNESLRAKDSRDKPPKNPLGIFRACLSRRLRHVPREQDASEAAVEGSTVEADLRYRGF
jgi:hypothetical protein